MQSIWNEIQKKFNSGDSYTKILYINVGIFFVYKASLVFSFLFQINNLNDFLINYLYFPSNTIEFLKKPWTIISYMFLHVSFMHILFNMIWFYFGSKLFLQYFNGKQLISVYIIGGISGALFYMLCYNLFPVFNTSFQNSLLLGASASVISIFIAVSTYVPNYRVSLPFFGNIQLKYIAFILIVLDIFNIEVSNPGGHISHLGGALFGYIYIKLLNKGIDISVNYHNFINYFTRINKNKFKKVYKRKNTTDDDIYRTNKANKQKKINEILEKISKSGYESLSKSEKEILFKESKK